MVAEEQCRQHAAFHISLPPCSLSPGILKFCLGKEHSLISASVTALSVVESDLADPAIEEFRGHADADIDIVQVFSIYVGFNTAVLLKTQHSRCTFTCQL